MNSRNNEKILIRVYFIIDSTIVNTTNFNTSVKFGEIVKYFEENIQNNNFKMKNKYFFNSKELQKNEEILNLINNNTNKKITEIEVIEIYIDIYSKNSLNEESEQKFNEILQPKFDKNFCLYDYIPSTGIISLEEYPENIINQYELNKFNEGSSYCNSPNYLYVSGGNGFHEKPINDFLIINHEDFSINNKKMPIGINHHSMLYIPDNLILMAGGSDTKCLFYDIKKDDFFKWANLNRIHKKPGLINIGKYVYCFSQLTDKNNYFEFTEITQNKPKWEKIYPIMKQEVSSFLYNVKNFCVAKSKSNNILLIAGEKIKEEGPSVFIYNVISNEITISDKQFEKILADDKSFYKVNNTYSILIPNNYNKNRNIIVLNKINNSLNKINFNPYIGIAKLKLIDENENNTKEKENGTLIIKIKYKSANNELFDKNAIGILNNNTQLIINSNRKFRDMNQKLNVYNNNVQKGPNEINDNSSNDAKNKNDKNNIRKNILKNNNKINKNIIDNNTKDDENSLINIHKYFPKIINSKSKTKTILSRNQTLPNKLMIFDGNNKQIDSFYKYISTLNNKNNENNKRLNAINTNFIKSTNSNKENNLNEDNIKNKESIQNDSSFTSNGKNSMISSETIKNINEENKDKKTLENNFFKNKYKNNRNIKSNKYKYNCKTSILKKHKSNYSLNIEHLINEDVNNNNALNKNFDTEVNEQSCCTFGNLFTNIFSFHKKDINVPKVKINDLKKPTKIKVSSTFSFSEKNIIYNKNTFNQKNKLLTENNDNNESEKSSTSKKFKKQRIKLVNPTKQINNKNEYPK